MSEVFGVIGSVAYDHRAHKWTGAPTAQNVDPSAIVLCSMALDATGQRVCLFNDKPSALLLEQWNGGEKVVVRVNVVTDYADLAALPPALRASYQPHHAPRRILVATEVAVAAPSAFQAVNDEVFTVSGKRQVQPAVLNPDNALENCLRGGVVMSAKDREGRSALIVVPELPSAIDRHVSGEACYYATSVTGTAVRPDHTQMTAILCSLDGSHRPDRVILAHTLRPAPRGGVG